MAGWPFEGRTALLAERGGTMHAFIIEDDYLIAQALQDSLDDLGFTSFSFARSEDAAVMGANEQRIELITADVRLLPGDGVRAVEAICARRDIPVIFITGFKEELQDRVANAIVLQKPVKDDDLAAAVRTALGRAGRIRKDEPARPLS